MHLPLPLFFVFNSYDGGNVHTVQPIANRQTQSYAITAAFLSRIVDCCHPYVQFHHLRICITVCTYTGATMVFSGTLPLMAERVWLHAWILWWLSGITLHRQVGM
jgi:hypothetical protein